MKNEIQRRCNQAFSSGSQDPVLDDEGADSDGLIRQPSSSVPLTLWKRSVNTHTQRLKVDHHVSSSLLSDYDNGGILILLFLVLSSQLYGTSC